MTQGNPGSEPSLFLQRVKMVERSLRCEAESRRTQSSLARSQTCQPQVQTTGLGCHQWGWSHLQRMLGNMAPLKHRPQQGQPHSPAPGPTAPTPIETCPIFGCRPPEVLTMSHKPMHPPDTAAMCSVRQAPRFTPERHTNPYIHTNMQRRMRSPPPCCTNTQGLAMCKCMLPRPAGISTLAGPGSDSITQTCIHADLSPETGHSITRTHAHMRTHMHPTSRQAAALAWMLAVSTLLSVLTGEERGPCQEEGLHSAGSLLRPRSPFQEMQAVNFPLRNPAP